MITLKRNEFYTVCTVEIKSKDLKPSFGYKEWSLLPILLIFIIVCCGFLWQTKVKTEYKEYIKNK